MSIVEQVKDALDDVDEATKEDVATEALMALLPEGVRDEAKPTIVGLVAARKSWIHYDDSQRSMSRTISEIESDPEDQRGMWLSSWETDVDRAIDGRDNAAESIERLLAGLAKLLGEEPPDDETKPAEEGFTVEASLTDAMLGPHPEGCLLQIGQSLMVMGIVGLVWVIAIWLTPIITRH